MTNLSFHILFACCIRSSAKVTATIFHYEIDLEVFENGVPRRPLIAVYIILIFF